jgi:hypothetical protein
VSPPDDQQLSDLLAFGEAMADRFRPILGEPLVYGGLAYAGHTGDWEHGLGDIDFLAPEAAFQQLLAICRDDASLRTEETSYHTLKVSRGDLRVSIDSIEAYLSGIAYQPIAMRVATFAFRAIDQLALAAAYRRAAETIPLKRAAYRRKLRGLTHSQRR